MKDIQYTKLGARPLFGSKATYDQEKTKAADAAMDEVKQLFQKQKPLSLTFSSADSEGNLIAVNKEGITFVLPYSELSSEEYSARVVMRQLMYSYEVVITSLDEAARRATVSYATIRERQAERIKRRINFILREQKQERIAIVREAERIVGANPRLCGDGGNNSDDLSDIVSGLSANPGGKIPMSNKTRKRVRANRIHGEVNELMDGSDIERIIVPVLVRAVMRDEAYVDIMGYGIKGLIPKYYWSYTHIQDLRNVVKQGDIVDIEIVGKYSAKEHGGMYICARTPLIENPWKNITFTVGTPIRVTASGISRSGWFGSMEGYEIEVYCEHPKKYLGFDIILGQQYECCIYKVDPDTLNIRARTLRHIEDRHR